MKAKTRTTLYRTLTPVVGDEEAMEDLLAQFPSRDVDDPITRDHLDARLAALQGEMRAGFVELRTEMADLRTEVRTEMADLRTEVQTEMADLRTEVRTGDESLRAEIRTAVQESQRQLVTWMVGVAGAVVACNAALLAGLVAILR